MHNGMITVAAVIIAAVAVAYYIGRIIERSANQKKYAVERDKNLREILSRDEKVERLADKINGLTELNSRYLAFMIKVPVVAQRLNGTLKFKEIVSSVIQLVKDIISTDRAELYILDRSDNLLKPASSKGGIGQEQISYAIGEGLIGIKKGVGLYAFNPLYEGQSIIVKSDMGDLNRNGIVRWCKELGDNIYRVGLLFL